MTQSKDEGTELDEAQKNQKKAGAAENDPETTGPAENLREEAADMVDEDKDEEEPV
jgi:hypothetical protein